MTAADRDSGSAPLHPVAPLVLGRLAFEPVDHTADLAYIARGRTMEELFANAALGMIAFLIDPATIEPRDEETILVAGVDREECLIAFLQEILFREEVQQRLYARFEVERTGPPEVRARAWGEVLDPKRHELLTDIKAATYHGLELRVEKTPEGPLHVVRIVLDI